MLLYIISCSLLVFATSCSSDKNADSISLFENNAQDKSCYDLASEVEFQKKIKKGIIKRQSNEATVADVGATVLTLGGNIVSNSFHKNNRNHRLEEIEQKLDIIEYIKEQKGC